MLFQHKERPWHSYGLSLCWDFIGIGKVSRGNSIKDELGKIRLETVVKKLIIGSSVKELTRLLIGKAEKINDFGRANF